MITLAPYSAGAYIDEKSEIAIIPALHVLNEWNLLTGEITCSFTHKKISSPITRLHVFIHDPTGPGSALRIALGYQSGDVCVLQRGNSSEEITFSGHKKTVTALCYQAEKSILASGSKDTDIILWDAFNGKGICKLKGHSNEVTDLAVQDALLFSSSKDGLVKIWDLESMLCVQSVVGTSDEVWSLALDTINGRLLAGYSNSKIRIWELKKSKSSVSTEHDTKPIDIDIKDDLLSKEESNKNVIKNHFEFETTFNKANYIGSIESTTKKRTFQLVFCGPLLYSVSSDKKIDIYQRFDHKRGLKNAKRRLRRKIEKVKKEKQDSSKESSQGVIIKSDVTEKLEIVAADAYKKLSTLTTKENVTSVSAFSNEDRNGLLVCFSDNSFALYNVDLLTKANKIVKIDSIKVEKRITKPGHRSAIRSVDIDSSESLVITGSNSEIKLWSLQDRNCISTIKTNFSTVTQFVTVPLTASIASPLMGNSPGSCSFALVGLKSGQLELYDLKNSTKVWEEKAHADSIWALEVDKEAGVIVSGGTDGVVKFWDFVVKNENISLVHTKSLEVADQINCIKLSPDKKLVAVGLLDSTIKVHYEDSFRFFLSLYGHKLPVLCIDISFDSRLLVSGSADKNVKIWGLDFGDCHKSIFAHDKSVTSVKFVNNSHLFFSAGKDKLVKFWDADKFEQLQVLRGHCAEVWGIRVGPSGETMISVSSDLSICVWVKGQPLFLEEENELELERELDLNEKNEIEREIRPAPIPGSGLSSALALEKATKSTRQSLTLAEEIRSSVDKIKFNLEAKSINFDGEFLPIGEMEFLAQSIELRKWVESLLIPIISQASFTYLDEALLTLPYSYARRVLKCLAVTLPNEKLNFEKCVHSVLFLAKLNETQLLDNSMRSTIIFLKKICIDKSKSLRDMVSCNIAALNIIKQTKISLMNEAPADVCNSNGDGIVDLVRKKEVAFAVQDIAA